MIMLASLPIMASFAGGAGAAAPAPVSLFGGAAGPNTASRDTNSVELGVRFRSTVSGTITALSYYKGTGGPDDLNSGHLWSRTGTLLASVDFAPETDSGWQQATLSDPVQITANTTYVASYFAPDGGYVSTHNYFADGPVVSGPLSASSYHNGVFCYADLPCFPNQTYLASNYYADVVFAPSTGAPADTTTTTSTTDTTVQPTTTTTDAPASTTSSTTTTSTTRPPTTTTTTIRPPSTTTSTTTTTTTTPAGSGSTSGAGTGGSYMVTDSQCPAAVPSCAMTFSDTALDRDPFSGVAYGDPKPGLLTGTDDSDLDTIASMPACTGSGPFHNCRPAGYSSGRLTLDAPANDNQTYYFDNCLITSPIQLGHSGIAVPGLSVYFSNCHVMITGDDGGYGTIGNAAGAGMHYIHVLFDGSKAPSTTHPLSFVAGTDNFVHYSEFSQNTDQAVIDAPVDFEWNYMHNSRCDKGTNAACVHTDGGPEVYGDAVQPTASDPIMIAHNYFSCLCDSSGGPANVAPYGGGTVRYLWIVDNKALPTYGSGYNSQGIIIDPQTGVGSISNVHITGNAFYASTSHPPSGLGDTASGGSCGGSLPNVCIAEISGNTKVGATGAVTSWP